MAEIAKTILTKLKLDSKEFQSGISETSKSVISLSASVTAAAAAVYALTSATAKYQDETIKAARSAGTTAETFSALAHAANMSGVEMEDMKKTMKGLAMPNKEMQEGMKSLGVSLTDAAGKGKTQIQILGEVADKIKGAASPAAQAGIAIKALGDDGAKMVTMLKGGKEGLKELTDEAKRMGLVVSQVAGENAEKFNESTKRLTESVKGLGISIGETIIAFLNGSGIMKIATDAIQGVTEAWNSLDEETKQTIITIGVVIAGIAALTLAIAGFVALAPIVGAAITAMTGGLNLAVAAIAALVVAFAAVAVGAVKYWDQVKTAIEPAMNLLEDMAANLVQGFLEMGSAIKSALAPIASALEPIFKTIGEVIGIVVDKFKEFFGITGQSTGQISILGTVAKVVFAAISSSIIIVVGGFKLLVDSAVFLGEALFNVGVAFKRAIIDQDFSGAKDALVKIKDSAIKLKDDFVNIGDKIKQSFSNIIVTVDTKTAKQEVEKLNTVIKKAVEPPKDDKKKWTDWVNTVGAVVNQVASIMNEIASTIEAGIKKSFDTIKYRLNLITGLYAAEGEKQQKIAEQEENDKLQKLNEKYDAEIAAIQDAEKRKLDALKFARNERELLYNEEYQNALKAQQEAFALWQEQETIKYEAEKELLLQKSIDKEQRMLVEAIMDNDFKLYMEGKQAEHEDKLKEMAKNFIDGQKADDEQYKNEQKNIEQSTKDEIARINKEKNDAITNQEKAKNDRLEALTKKRQEEEKASKKAEAFITWQAEKAVFESTKGMRIASLIVAGAANAAMAFGMAFAQLGPIAGSIVGGINAALIATSTALAVRQIMVTQAPPPPAALFMASGGYVAGPPHSAGGVSATLEGGEGVIDSIRTKKLMDSVDDKIGGKAINIIFESGSIQNSGNPMDESFIDKISYAISRRLERNGVYA